MNFKGEKKIIFISSVVLLLIFLLNLSSVNNKFSPVGTGESCGISGALCYSGYTCEKGDKTCGPICCPSGFEYKCNTRILNPSTNAPLNVPSCVLKCPDGTSKCGENTCCKPKECVEQSLNPILGDIGSCVPSNKLCSAGTTPCYVDFDSSKKLVGCCNSFESCQVQTLRLKGLTKNYDAKVYVCLKDNAKECPSSRPDVCGVKSGSVISLISPTFQMCCPAGNCLHNTNGAPYCYGENYQ